jgi:hypothetical protein
MAYDDLKEHDGETYTGMPVGAGHDWTYPDGRWRETKQGPDRWRFSFSSRKEREDPAPPGSGAETGARYHWYMIAHQRVRKLDKDTYATRMEGLKAKIGHKRPHWNGFSYEYDDQPSALDRVIEVLEERLAELKARRRDGQARLDGF